MFSSCQHLPNNLNEWRFSSSRGTRQSWSHTYREVIEDWGHSCKRQHGSFHSYSSHHLTDQLWRPLAFHHCISPAPDERPALFEAEPGLTLSSLDAGFLQGLSIPRELPFDPRQVHHKAWSVVFSPCQSSLKCDGLWQSQLKQILSVGGCRGRHSTVLQYAYKGRPIFLILLSRTLSAKTAKNIYVNSFEMLPFYNWRKFTSLNGKKTSKK